MEEGQSTWLKRHELELEAERCNASSRILLYASPLYFFFPVLLLAVVPTFIIIRRQHYLCGLQIERLRELACKELTGLAKEDPALAPYARWVVDPFRRPR